MRHKDVPTDVVYVGRPTKWENPFSHFVKGTLAIYLVESREEAVSSYQNFIMKNPELLAQARSELKGKDLACWCAPARCHAEALIEIANTEEDNDL